MRQCMHLLCLFSLFSFTCTFVVYELHINKIGLNKCSQRERERERERERKRERWPGDCPWGSSARRGRYWAGQYMLQRTRSDSRAQCLSTVHLTTSHKHAYSKFFCISHSINQSVPSPRHNDHRRQATTRFTSHILNISSTNNWT